MLLLSKLYWDCGEEKRDTNEGGKEGGREERGGGRAQVEVQETQGLKGRSDYTGMGELREVCGTGACVTARVGVQNHFLSTFL